MSTAGPGDPGPGAGPGAASGWDLGEEPDDRTLLAAHVAGAPDAFATLVTRHRDRLWAVALRTTGHREEAADALQDAMVSAYRRAEDFRGEAAVTTWLHRIVVNACLDRLRRNAVRAADPLPDDLEHHAARGAVLGATEADADRTDPARASLAAERRRLVLSALAALTPEQRAALVLVDMEGYPVEEAAAILGCAPGTVKSRCSRGRARLAPLLRSALAADGDQHDAPHESPETRRASVPDPDPGPAGTGSGAVPSHRESTQPRDPGAPTAAEPPPPPFGRSGRARASGSLAANPARRPRQPDPPHSPEGGIR